MIYRNLCLPPHAKLILFPAIIIIIIIMIPTIAHTSLHRIQQTLDALINQSHFQKLVLALPKFAPFINPLLSFISRAARSDPKCQVTKLNFSKLNSISWQPILNTHVLLLLLNLLAIHVVLYTYGS